MPPPRPISRPLETYGVAKALDTIRDDVTEDLRRELPAHVEEAFLAWLVQERAAGRLELAEDQLSALAHRTGALAAQVAAPLVAKSARMRAGTAVAEAWQMGINRDATEAEYAATTGRFENRCPACGAPLVQKK